MNDLSVSRLSGEDRLADRVTGGPEVEIRRGPPVLVHYLRIAKRWKWLILAMTVVGGIIGLIVTLLMTPMYVASAKVEIQRQSYQIVNVESVEPKSGLFDQEFYQTQYGLLKSQSLAERVVRTLRLADDPNFFEAFDATEVAAKLRANDPKTRTAEDRAKRQRMAANVLLNGISVNPVRQSQLVDVAFRSPSPQFSARIVNAWTSDFIEATLERRFEATSYARKFLEERLE